MNSVKKFTLIVAAVVIFVVGMRLVGINQWRKRNTWTRTTPAQIDAQVRQNLPVGTPKSGVESYLDAHSIVHTYYGGGEKNNECSRCEIALVRDTQSSGLITSSVQIVFKFDDAMRLASYQIREINTGP